MFRVRHRGLGACVAIAIAAALWPFAAADAHAGASLCHGEFENDGHGEGRCELPFQGFPIGVLGTYDAGGPGGTDAQIHVEVFAKTLDGSLRPLGIECDDEDDDGTAECASEQNPLGEPVTAPEPVPAGITHLVCIAHSHADVAPDTSPTAGFACWSTDEARRALAEDGYPAPDHDPEGDHDGTGADGGTGTATVILTVPVNTYAPQTNLVDRTLGLRYRNLDVNRHDVVSDATRPDGSAPWCSGYGPDECPLFRTPLLDNGHEAPVSGLDDTEAGQSYSFYCSLHPYMVGTVEVVA